MGRNSHRSSVTQGGLKGEWECPGAGVVQPWRNASAKTGTCVLFVGASIPGGTTVSSEARALSKDCIMQGLECRAKEFDFAQ